MNLFTVTSKILTTLLILYATDFELLAHQDSKRNKNGIVQINAELQ